MFQSNLKDKVSQITQINKREPHHLQQANIKDSTCSLIRINLQQEKKKKKISAGCCVHSQWAIFLCLYVPYLTCVKRHFWQPLFVDFLTFIRGYMTFQITAQSRVRVSLDLVPGSGTTVMCVLHWTVVMGREVNPKIYQRSYVLTLISS